MILVLFTLQINLFSCAPEQTFSDVIVCSSINNKTFAPVTEEDEFNLDIQKIYACIKVSGVRSFDAWKFVWKNIETGEIIGKTSGFYSSEGSGYIEGYIANNVVPNEESKIIGIPGNYIVEFYNNDILKKQADFKIIQPVPEIEDVSFGRQISENGLLEDQTDKFMKDDSIFMAVKLNYRLTEGKLLIKWFNGKGEFLGEKEYIFDRDYYEPGQTVFEITNESSWPYDDYRIELYYNGDLYEDYTVSVVPDENYGLAFTEKNLYSSEKFNFKINYPDGWLYEEQESKSGLKVSFAAESGEINSVLNMWVFSKNYYPPEESYLEFADDIVSGIEDLGSMENAEKTVNDSEIAGIKCKEVIYSNPEEEKSGWEIRLNFIYNNDKLYLFISITDFYNIEFTEIAYRKVLDTLSFS